MIQDFILWFKNYILLKDLNVELENLKMMWILLPHVFLIPPFKPIVNKWNYIQNSVYPPTNCTALVQISNYSILGNTLNLSRFTKFLRDITYIPYFQFSILIGLILGDAHIELGKNNTNPRIKFTQSIINFPFFWTVFMYLIHYVSSMPIIAVTKLGAKSYLATVFQTRSYPVFLFLYNLFYVNKVKTISDELFHYINPIALAYWIMCDGVSAQYGVVLCSESFTLQENIKLINILKIKFDLNCSLHTLNRDKSQYRIYIRANSMKTLHSLVDPYIIPFSSYKLRKGTRN